MIVEESLSSAVVVGSAVGCVECFQSLGLDPTVSAALAVIIAVSIRVAADVWRERRRDRNKEAGSA